MGGTGVSVRGHGCNRVWNIRVAMVGWTGWDDGSQEEEG